MANELNKAAEEYAQNETMSGLAERAFKAGAEWQREQYGCIPAEEAYMRGFAQGAKEERESLSHTMLTYAADVFSGKMLLEDISYSYRQELAEYFRDLAKLPKEN